MSCCHVQGKIPTPSSTVYREECTMCFDSQDSPGGLDVCLVCYNGSCTAFGQGHSMLHYQKTGHSTVLNIKRSKIQKEGARPQKMTKLSIEEGQSEDDYNFETIIKCLACGDMELGKDVVKEKGMDKVAQAIITSMSAMKKSQLKAWEEDSIQPCYHTSELVQVDGIVQDRTLAHCKDCDVKENLWLCLTCGNLGCGRAQYGGLGGNSHGISHFENTRHPVAVKMGSITPEGTADIFCYEHGSEITNPQLAQHLGHFGINIAAEEKTVKSIAEMQLEQNLKFDFSMTTEDGKEMLPLTGPGLTGIVNLGNSCYMASVLQTLFSIPSFEKKYFKSTHPNNCTTFPADCLHCQMAKIADGILSGRYSLTVEEKEQEKNDGGISPGMFKNLIGKGHPEFSTMRQQDAQEFMQHLLSTIEQKEQSSGFDPSKSCRFFAEHRVQCMECEHVSYKKIDTSSLTLRIPAIPSEMIDGKQEYKPVDLSDCIHSYFEADLREFCCTIDKTKTTASFTERFHTYPDYLFCVANRFILGKDWVMEKLNLAITAPLELSLDGYRAIGPQENEKKFPEEDVPVTEPNVDQAALDQLLTMGFPEIRCKRALLKTGNNGADVAMNWLFEHMEDPDIDAPLQPEALPASTNTNTANLLPLMDMGFTETQARIAMKETGGYTERAVDWLFSHPDVSSLVEGPTQPQGDSGPPVVIDAGNAIFSLTALISHKGTSAQCGHYVAFVRKNDTWVLFNDNKVVQVPDMTENIQQAYVYIYKRN